MNLQGQPEYTDWAWYCLSCALRIGEKFFERPGVDFSWMRYYRALHMTSEGVKIGGITKTEYIWEDQVLYDFPGLPEKLGPWYSMVAARPAKAYLFHEDCWVLLCQQFATDIDLNKLFEVCKDVPPYGRDVYHGGCVYDAPINVEIRRSPLNQPDIEGLIDARRHKFPTFSKKRKLERPSSSKSDPFDLLPVEIRTQIAIYLSTSDFLRLRELFRPMAGIFWSQTFWKSRFLPSGDRGFLYCVLLRTEEVRDEPKDWRLVYRCTSKVDQKHPFLWQKRRQWQNNRWLKERCTMSRDAEHAVIRQRASIDKLRIPWQTVSTTLRCDRNVKQGTDEKACARCWAEHIPFVQVMPIKESVTSLTVSILHEGDTTYITGIDLTEGDLNDSKMTLGYRMPESNAILKLDEKRPRGFHIITGEAGIHAMRVIFDDFTYSQWAGHAEGVTSQCTELLVDQNIQAVSGKFDYCKMIEFSID